MARNLTVEDLQARATALHERATRQRADAKRARRRLRAAEIAARQDALPDTTPDAPETLSRTRRLAAGLPACARDLGGRVVVDAALDAWATSSPAQRGGTTQATPRTAVPAQGGVCHVA